MQIRGLAKIVKKSEVTVTNTATNNPNDLIELDLSDVRFLISDPDVDEEVSDEFEFIAQITPSGSVKISLIPTNIKSPDNPPIPVFPLGDARYIDPVAEAAREEQIQLEAEKSEKVKEAEANLEKARKELETARHLPLLSTDLYPVGTGFNLVDEIKKRETKLGRSLTDAERKQLEAELARTEVKSPPSNLPHGKADALLPPSLEELLDREEKSIKRPLTADEKKRVEAAYKASLTPEKVVLNPTVVPKQP